jgi:hypothetical protein
VDRVERADTPVMFLRAEDSPVGITAAWTQLESCFDSLKGRKFFGAFEPESGWPDRDDARPSIEFYRRRDEIDLLLPVT